MTENLSLFQGDETEELGDRFQTAKERYGVWPTTVWECDHGEKLTRTMKRMVGDNGSAREGCLQVGYSEASCYQNGASIFNPAVAAWTLNMYAPTSGVCFDPFAGGGTRAIMALKHGLDYVGVEVREAEVEATRSRISMSAGDLERARVLLGDSRDCSSLVPSGCADFLYTCPPYWNLEEYRGGKADLSMLPTYDDFCRELRRVVGETHRVLKPGSLACWVIGLHRDRDGTLLPMHHDISRLHREAGFRMKEEVILVQKGNGAIRRVGTFEKGRKQLVRVHEYLLVFTR